MIGRSRTVGEMREPASRRALWLQLLFGAVVTVVLFLPSFRFGFMFDDHVMVAAQDRSTPHLMTQPLSVYRFMTGNPPEVLEAIKAGELSWWNDPEHQHTYLRPVTSALFWVDHALFGRWAPGYRIHQVLWYLALLAAVVLLLRRFLPDPLAALAGVLFALTDPHAIAVLSISGLHHVASGALVLWGLVAHVRWREDDWRPGLPLALVATALGLFASESGIQALGYVAAYELCGAPGSLAKRARSLAPVTILLVAFLALYKGLGYGVEDYGTGGYAEPFQDPLGFLSNVVTRLPFYLCVPFGAGLRLLLKPEGPVTWALAAAALCACFGPLVVLGLRALEPPARRAVRWILLGGLFALLPAFASYNVTDEAYLLPSFAGVVATALALLAAWRLVADRARAWPWRAYGVIAQVWLVGTIALVGPAIWYWLPGLRDRAVVLSKRPLEGAEIPREARHVILLAQLPMFLSFPTGLNAFPARPRGQVLLTLSPETCPHVVERTGPRDLELVIACERSTFYWPRRFAIGDVIVAGPMTIRIVELRDGTPARLAVTFERDLEDPSLAFLAWRGRVLAPQTMPPVGGKLELGVSFGDLEPGEVMLSYLGTKVGTPLWVKNF